MPGTVLRAFCTFLRGSVLLLRLLFNLPAKYSALVDKDCVLQSSICLFIENTVECLLNTSHWASFIYTYILSPGTAVCEQKLIINKYFVGNQMDEINRSYKYS